MEVSLAARPPAGKTVGPRWSALALVALSACGGGDDGGGQAGQDPPRGPGEAPVEGDPRATAATLDPRSGLLMAPGRPMPPEAEPPLRPGLSERDAARFLTQATFGIRGPEDVKALQAEGIDHWLWRQFRLPFALHVSYLDMHRSRHGTGNATEEMSYEAVWRQWLFEEGQLRARVAFALSQILVVSNVAPDIKPYALSSYMDLLNYRAFGTFRALLQEVTLHPAMGYFLNMLQSRREDPELGTHPNENYAREVLQLFSIGLVKLNLDGSPQLGSDGKPIAAYDEAVVKGFARAFSGWSFGGEGNDSRELFYGAQFNRDDNWVVAMKPFAHYHESGPKQLLDGVVLPAGQSPHQDLNDALDNICNHPNVGPFIGRQLIQRLVTSNPSGGYIARVAGVFNDNGQGVRGDLRAVVRAILTDPQAREDAAAAQPHFGKQREPLIRFASYLRAFGARTASPSGRTDLHHMSKDGDTLGQSPLLAPSVFNFFSPGYRHPGVLAQQGLVAPEFQITTESTLVGVFNAFTHLVNWGGHGWNEDGGPQGAGRLDLDFEPWLALMRQSPEAVVSRLDLVLFNARMSATTRQRLLKLLRAGAPNDWGELVRLKKALIIAAVSPDFVIQK